MADITTDKKPGYYGGAITVNITFPPSVRKAIVTRDDVAPVFSEIIAYDKDPDTQVKRPFLAVTQDGKGNVVYDGGFPKYYNSNVNAAPVPTTFAQLNGSCKFFHNALKFCANPTKVAAGNNKILIVGNTVNGDSFNHKYSMKNNVGPSALQASGMADSWLPTTSIAGFVPTVMGADDFPGGKIDLPFSFLDQFCMVVFLSSYPIYDQTSRLTARSASEVATYRSAGNGVFIITDHCGDVYSSVADAVARRTIFASDAILMAAPYGAWFSGDYDRTNVRVGDIRAENGDHPLFANIGDNEYIIGMVSESIVYVEDHAADVVNPAVVQTYNLTTAGTHRLNPLAQMNDGSIIVRPFRYDLIDPSNLLMRDARNRTIGAAFNSVKKGFDLNVMYNIGSPPTMRGRILRNGVPYGTFQLDNNVMSKKMCTGNESTFEFLPTDTLTFAFELPFIYNVDTVVGNVDKTPAKTSWTRVSALTLALSKMPDYAGITPTEALRQYWQYASPLYRDEGDTGGNMFGYWPRVLSRVGRALNGVPGSCKLWIATSAADWTANKPANPQETDTVVQADNNNVYTWWITDGVGAWVTSTLKANEFFGVNRLIVDKRVAGTWKIGLTTTVKQ
jgi:hypothetical protein